MDHRGNGGKPVSKFSITLVLVLSLVFAAKLIIWLACGLWTHDWSWISAFHKWDSYWYERIAEQGYNASTDIVDGVIQDTFAFFPSYPLLAHAASGIFNISVPWAMEVLSYPIAMACLWGAWTYFSIKGINPQRGLLNFLLWPFSLFLFVHYSDALFIALVLWALVALARAQDRFAAACLALLAITRPNGIFFLPVVALLIVERENRKRGSSSIDRFILQRVAAVLIGPILSFSVWCVVQWRLTGNPFAFSAAQSGWSRKLSWPWEGFFASGDLATQLESWYTLALIMITAWYWRRMTWPYRSWLVLGILGPLLSGSVDSMTRFALAFIPLVIAVSTDLERAKRPYVTYAALVGSQLLCLSLWALYHPLMA